MDRLVQLVIARSRGDYRPTHIAYGYLFFTLVPITVGPLVIRLVGSWFDGWLGLGNLLPGRASLGVALACFSFGVPWLVWAAALDWIKGSGTPLPWFPPKRLLLIGPYKYVRNPQTFGAVFWWCGWVLVFNSPAGLVVGIGAIGCIVLCYIRFVEEHELVGRFGQRYLDYKVRTPFLLPVPRVASGSGVDVAGVETVSSGKSRHS